RIDRPAAAKQRTQPGPRAPLDDDDPPARGERAQGLLETGDTQLWFHVRKEPVLVVEHDEIERRVVEWEGVETAGSLDFQQHAAYLYALARARRIGFRRHDLACASS